MLSLSCNFSNLNFNSVEDFKKAFTCYKEIEDYIKELEPNIPYVSYLIGNPFEVKILSKSLFDIFDKENKYLNAILLHYIRTWKKNEYIGLKENLRLVDKDSSNLGKNINNLFYIYNKSSSLIEYLKRNFYIEHNNVIKPNDNQTILNVDSLFTSTTKRCKSHGDKKVFIHKKSNYYCYLDSFHSGNSVHIEVFESKNNFKGKMHIYSDEIIKINESRSCKSID